MTLRWTIPIEMSPGNRLVDRIMAELNYSGMLEALKQRSPKFPEDFQEIRPFWTGFVELAPTSRWKVGDSVQYILNFMRDVHVKPTKATISEGPFRDNGKNAFIVEDAGGRMKIYEEEIQ